MNAPRAEKLARPDEAGWLTRERALVLVLIAATILAFLLCYLLVRPFVPVLAWALALAIVARPLHDVIARRFGNADVAAGLTVAVVALVILLPALFVVQNLVAEAGAAAEWVQGETQKGQWLDKLESTPWLGPAVQWLSENVDMAGALQQLAASFTGTVPEVVAGSIWAAIQILLILFTLFFFFRDQGKALGLVRGVMPLSDAETDEVMKRVADTVHATIYGSVFVALIQGTMGGLIFWWLGLPAPVLWGFVMAVLAVIPNLGAYVVWGPAALVLALNGDWTRAIVLAVWGAIAIGFIDNLLYPYLVGHRMRLHTLPVFYAIVGGVFLMGATGVVLGPLILVITLALVDVWRLRTARGQPAEAGVRSPPPIESAARRDGDVETQVAAE